MTKHEHRQKTPGTVAGNFAVLTAFLLGARGSGARFGRGTKGTSAPETATANAAEPANANGLERASEAGALRVQATAVSAASNPKRDLKNMRVYRAQDQDHDLQHVATANRAPKPDTKTSSTSSSRCRDLCADVDSHLHHQTIGGDGRKVDEDRVKNRLRLPNARTLVALVATTLVASVGTLVAAPTEALAVRGHVFTAKIGEPGSGPGQLSEPTGVAVNETTGDVYVVDTGNHRVEWFDPTTKSFEGQFDGSGSNLNENVAKLPPGQFAKPEAIAVDNDPSSPSFGDVYVDDREQGVVDKFTATGEYVAQLTGTCENPGEIPPSCSGFKPFTELDGVGVNNTGELFIYQGVEPDIGRFTSNAPNEFAGGFHSESVGQPTRGFATEPDGNDFYVVSGPQVVSKIDPTGKVLDGENKNERVGLDEFGVAPGGAGVLAVEASGDVYVDHGLTVGRFSSAGKLEETLGEGLLQAGSGVAVSSASETVYVADSTAGVLDVFTPAPVSGPKVSDEAAAEVTSDTARLSGEVRPDGLATTYGFVYGPCATSATCASSAYPSSAGAGVLPADFGEHAVSVTLEGLASNTIYHFRLVAENGEGKAEGAEQVFTTQVGASEFTLLDGRRWEMVSPPNKYGTLIEPLRRENEIQAASGGGALAYLPHGPIELRPQSNTGGQALAIRTRAGWSSRDIEPPVYGPETGGGKNYQLFSEDLLSAVVQPNEAAFPPPGSPQPFHPKRANRPLSCARTI